MFLVDRFLYMFLCIYYMYDVIIIGGGPAGISAALYAARQKMKFIIICSKIGGMANLIPNIKSYLGLYYISGYDLVKKFVSHLNNYKVKVNENERVVKVKKKGKSFLVKTNKREYKTRSVIIASGRKSKHLDIKTEEEFINKGVSHCAACDGPIYRKKDVAIIGGGRSGVLSAMYMMNIARRIYLIERKGYIENKGAWKQFADAIKKSKKIDIITDAKIISINGNKFVDSIDIKKKGRVINIPVKGVFVEVGYEPNSDFVKGLVRLNKRGEIKVNKECKTNVPGIFAAGDVTDIYEKQVVTSVGDGAKALLGALVYLESN